MENQLQIIKYTNYKADIDGKSNNDIANHDKADDDKFNIDKSDDVDKISYYKKYIRISFADLPLYIREFIKYSLIIWDDEHKYEPLIHLAIRTRETYLIDYILKLNIDINESVPGRGTALQYACSLNPPLHSDLIELLLLNKANVNTAIHIKTTALCLASQHPSQFPTTIKLLLKYNANVNGIHCICCRTALFMAVHCGSKEICKILIENYANVNVIDKYDQTPVDIAYRQFRKYHSDGQQYTLSSKFFDIILLLLENGAHFKLDDQMMNECSPEYFSSPADIDRYLRFVLQSFKRRLIYKNTTNNDDEYEPPHKYSVGSFNHTWCLESTWELVHMSLVELPKTTPTINCLKFFLSTVYQRVLILQKYRNIRSFFFERRGYIVDELPIYGVALVKCFLYANTIIIFQPIHENILKDILKLPLMIIRKIYLYMLMANDDGNGIAALSTEFNVFHLRFSQCNYTCELNCIKDMIQIITHLGSSISNRKESFDNWWKLNFSI